MLVSRDAILEKTHRGLTIYSSVLRYYYPGETVLSLRGKDCLPAKNPFNDDKPTLLITIADGCAKHTDTDKAIAPGNAFDFAALHFGIQEPELLQRLNHELNLRLDCQNGRTPRLQNKHQAAPPSGKKPDSNVFSYFNRPVSNVVPARQVSLAEVYHLVKGDSFLKNTTTLRNIQDAREARKFKARNFDYVTFSGTFSKRNDANLLKHSGLITVDFDHIPDITALKQKLLHDPCFETQLLFVSPSGDGLKWVIPADLSRVKHQDYFRAVANYIRHTYNLVVDQSGKDISRACFLPHDAEVFINPKFL
jgi:hypothetical protein